MADVDWSQLVMDSFKSFGYTPSQAEIQAFVPLEEGGAEGQMTAGSAIANYVQAHQLLTGAQSQIQGQLLSETQASAMSESLGKILETQGQGAYDAAAQIFTQAPKLFGSMTADQVTQYIQPLINQFNQASGSAQGAAASRGLAGSSIEGNILGKTQNEFEQQVLSQGLGIGQDQQTRQAAILQALGGQQFAAGQQQFGLGAQYSGQAQNSALANYGAASDLAGLPSQAFNNALSQQAALRALNPPSGPGPLGGYLGAGLGFLAGGPIGANIGGNIGSAVTGNPVGARIGAAVNPLASLLGTNQSGAYGGGGGAGNTLQGITTGNWLRGLMGGGGGGGAGYLGSAGSAGATSGLTDAATALL